MARLMVGLAWRALLRAWRASGDDGTVWLQFTASTKTSSVEAVREAVRLANAESEDAEGATPIGETSVLDAPGGPIITIGYCDSAEALNQWLQTFIASLRDDGLEGRVGPVRTARDRLPELSVPAMCAAVSLPIALDAAELQAQRNKYRWFVAADLTEAAVDLALSWCMDNADRYSVRKHMTRVEVGADEVGALVRTILAENEPTDVVCGQDERAFRIVHFDALGRILYEQRQESRRFVEDAVELRELLMRHAPHAEYGFVKRSLARTATVELLHRQPPQPPLVAPHYVNAARELDRTHVPDAFAIQLLGPQHLKGIDLPPDRWSAETPADGWAIVSARSLDEWFDPDPSDEVLRLARQDFEPILATNALAQTRW